MRLRLYRSEEGKLHEKENASAHVQLSGDGGLDPKETPLTCVGEVANHVECGSAGAFCAVHVLRVFFLQPPSGRVTRVLCKVNCSRSRLANWLFQPSPPRLPLIRRDARVPHAVPQWNLESVSKSVVGSGKHRRLPCPS